MEKAEQFTEEKLQRLKYDEIKSLLQIRGLSTQGYKQKLISRLLEYQKTGQGKKARKPAAKSIPTKSSLPVKYKGLYIEGKGKYQREYDYLVTLSRKDEIFGEDGVFFKEANEIYRSYFDRHIPYGDEYLEIRIKEDLLDPDYEKLLSSFQNISSPRDYEVFMDEVVSLVSKKVKNYQEKLDSVVSQLYSYQNPTYIDIPTPSNLLDYIMAEAIGDESIDQLEYMLVMNRVIFVRFKAGDIAGFRDEKSAPDSLPDLLVYFTIKNGKLASDSKLNYKADYKRFRQSGRVEYPGDLKYASPETLQQIYSFPFYHT